MTFFKPSGQGAIVLWPLVGSLNQLMAALALGVVSVYLFTKKIPTYYTLIPMIIILVLTLWSMQQSPKESVGPAEPGRTDLAGKRERSAYLAQ